MAKKVKGIQWAVYRDDKCLTVIGNDRLLQLCGQFENHKGHLSISARGVPPMQIPASVCVAIADTVYRGQPATFSYLGEAYPISNGDEFVNLLMAVNTHRLYVDGAIIKTSATTYSTVFRETKECG